MFADDLPIDNMRTVSLNRLRKFRRSLELGVRCKKRLRADDVTISSPIVRQRPIRRVSYGEESAPVDVMRRMQRIVQLKLAISEGRYHVSAEALAQKILDRTKIDSRPKDS
jgi:anti-sigma28 factor (negative regulator of flagellin synthesis)